MGTPTRNKIKSHILLLIGLTAINVDLVTALTCPGFPGYCSESFPGQTCVVVCSKGRNNVPLCQEDGSWTDIPRCIEHEPGVKIQIPGLCPGIAGYCSEGFLNDRCRFNCPVGPDINSHCTQDGTWEPYPTCAGDLREVQDGCDPCPGPFGGPRNRTAEAILGTGPEPRQRKPKDQQTQGRVVRPTFAGNQVFGELPSKASQPIATRPRPTPASPRPAPAPTPAPQLPSQSSFFKFASGQRSPFPFSQQRPQFNQQRPQFGQQRPPFSQSQFSNQNSFSSFPRQQSRPAASSTPRLIVGPDGRVRQAQAAQSPVRPAAPQQPRPPQPPAQPRRISSQPARPAPPSFPPPPPAAAPVPPPPQPVGPVAIFEEDDPSVPTIGGNTDDFFGPFQVFDPQEGPSPPPVAGPELPSFPAIPVSDRNSAGRSQPSEFGPFKVVPL